MLHELETPLGQLPRVVTMAMMARQDPLGGGADLRRVFQPALRHTRLQFRQALPYALHRFLTLPLLVAAPFIAVDHEHAHAFTITRHFLHARPLLDHRLLAIDAARTIEPA